MSKKGCEHKEVLRWYGPEGVNVSQGQPRYYKCTACGKKSVNIQDFKVIGSYR